MIMNFSIPSIFLISALLSAPVPGSELRPPDGTLDPLLVEGTDDAPPWASGAREIDRSGPAAADGGDLLRGMPGVVVMRNGPQSGIAQIRGLGGDRVRVRVDDRTITPACPNHMDPPLHYAQRWA